MMTGIPQRPRRSFRIRMTNVSSFTITLSLLLLFLLAPTAVQAEAEAVRIGVLAKSGVQTTLDKWSATADFLSEKLPEYHFSIIPLGFQEIHQAVRQGKVDFVLANSAFYIELEMLYGVSRIATLVNQSTTGQQTTTFGGTIFTKSDRTDLNTLADLKGQSFMAADPLSFGGWIMVWREMHRKGINPFRHFRTLDFAGIHEKVVLAVLAGQADAGVVRADTLERMAEKGVIRLNQVKVINQQHPANFPFLVSTELYPEWPMAATRATSDKLARRVAGALMSMDSNDPAARASETAGWTIPLNYQSVHDCLQELRIGPYKDYGKFSLADVLKRYWRQFALLTIAVLLIIVVSWYVLLLNRILRRKKQEVENLNITLESRVAQRTEKINALLGQQIYLKGILQTVADINKLLITSPNVAVLLKKACELFVQHGHYGFSWVGLVEEAEIKTIYSPEDFEKYLAHPPFAFHDQALPFYDSPTARCLRENIIIISDRNHTEDLTPWRNKAEIQGFRFAIALPLRPRESAAPLGALTIYTWQQEGFEPEEIAMLEELAGDIGFAINSFRHQEEVDRLTFERTVNYEETIFTFVNMIEQRDTYTAGHTERVASYCQKIAKALKVSDQEIAKLYKAAILHDIGKIATPDSVLLKPGKLSGLDYELIKLHATAGYEMLANMAMYKDLADIILHHHERHDGQGYPDGLKGDDIPFLSRILTVADAFDAMTTNRIYKPRKQIQEALDELASLAGSQFNPEIVDVAIKALQETANPLAVTQAPVTDTEKKRFSYFFNDRLTGLFNEDYLRIFLLNNANLQEYNCLHILHLHNVLAFNKKKGWEQGNLLFQNFATELQAHYPEALIFRAYSNDFTVISRKHFDMTEDAFKSFTSLAGSEVTVEPQHIDLRKGKVYTIDKLEKMEIYCPIDNKTDMDGRCK